MSGTFGTLFKVTSFGESHSKGIGVITYGCPPGISISKADIQPQLNRRRPGQNRLTTARNEPDQVNILSGIENGLTLGTPVALFFTNRDAKPDDYKNIEHIPRPSHADYTYYKKYGIRSVSGGGRASARETIARVGAGAIAEKYLSEAYGVEIVAWVSSVGNINACNLPVNSISRSHVDKTIVRSGDPKSADNMINEIEKARKAKDSIGGIISCVCRNVPAGLGEPVFDKAEALLAHAMLSIPAAKGFEIGSGFASARMRGSEHNDRFVKKGDHLGTLTNNSGGIQGGISNGEPILFSVGFKPTPTIGRIQETVDFNGNNVSLAAKGRHDPCIVPRAVPIVEAMAALVIADLALRQEAGRSIIQ